MSCVLDASAIIALALGERGGGVVAALAKGALMSAVNMSEFLQRMADRNVPHDDAAEQLARFEIDIVAFQHHHAIQAAAYRPLTRHLGLSLGDRACLALARERQSTILTADRRMAEANVGLDIRMIR
ncbi:type II toxin-antitoxin system VapC family toxin [Sphingomonas sp. CCH9-E2]|nr:MULTISPECIES: type II toxin-antitoxin system VapC family toxin [unclassified Sphingomonas]